MALLTRLLPAASEERAIGLWDIPWGPSTPNAAGVTVNENTALNLSTVWACETLIADSIAMLPVDVTENRDGTQVEVDAPKWVHTPNPETSRIDFDTQRILSLLGWGNAYILLVRSNGGPIVERWVMDPARVSVRRINDKLVYFHDGQALPDGSVQHICGYRLPGASLGMSVVQSAAQSMGIGIAAERFGAKFFAQGANPSGVLEVPALPADVSQEVVDRLRVNWFQRHGGAENANKPAVLTGGTKWNQISTDPDDAQLLETRRFQVSEMARWFRVPPHMVGDVEKSTSWGTGIEQQTIGFAQWTLQPWTIRLETSDTSLLPERERLRYNLAAAVRADLKTRYEAHSMARMGGWVSANEIRALEDQPPIEGGDIVLQPLNMAPLGAESSQEVQ